MNLLNYLKHRFCRLSRATVNHLCTVSPLFNLTSVGLRDCVQSASNHVPQMVPFPKIGRQFSGFSLFMCVHVCHVDEQHGHQNGLNNMLTAVNQYFSDKEASRKQCMTLMKVSYYQPNVYFRLILFQPHMTSVQPKLFELFFQDSIHVNFLIRKKWYVR